METKEDKERQQEVQKLIARAWNLDIKELDGPNEFVYHVDYTAYEIDTGPIHHWGEIKCRDNSSTKYPTLMISVHKILHGTQFAAITNTPFYIIARFNDGKVMFHRWGNLKNGERYTTAWNGNRTGRGVDVDEPVMHIPMSAFTEFTERLEWKD
jgi:hypothetical protein